MTVQTPIKGMHKCIDMKTSQTLLLAAAIILVTGGMTSCSKKSSHPTQPVSPDSTVTPVNSQVAFWLTNTDMSALFQQQNIALNFSTGPAVQPVITVDTTTTYQTIDGFGYCLTGGSAQLIYGLPQPQRTALEQELFGTDSNNIGVSYLRLTIGASDMSARIFSYDDNASPYSPIRPWRISRCRMTICTWCPY